jgi:hypothetical protein
MNETYPLPSRFGRILRNGAMPTGGVLRFFARNVEADRTTVRADFRVLDESGALLMVLDGIEGTHSKELNRLSPAAATPMSSTA